MTIKAEEHQAGEQQEVTTTLLWPEVNNKIYDDPMCAFVGNINKLLGMLSNHADVLSPAEIKEVADMVSDMNDMSESVRLLPAGSVDRSVLEGWVECAHEKIENITDFGAFLSFLDEKGFMSIKEELAQVCSDAEASAEVGELHDKLQEWFKDRLYDAIETAAETGILYQYQEDGVFVIVEESESYDIDDLVI